MNETDYRRVADEIKCKQDERNPPDERRRGRFKAGWDAAVKGSVYRDKTLRVLTWQNLGYRFGKALGEATEPRVDEAYSYLARLYKTGHGDMFVLAPSPHQYVKAMRSVGCSDLQRRMFEVHYGSPVRTITATQMSKRLGYKKYGAANIHYGRLGGLVGESLDFDPWKERLGTLVTFTKRNKEWNWTMRPQVTLALEKLGWVEKVEPLTMDEVSEEVELSEGKMHRVSTKAYERNPKARKLCISHHGASCCVCGFDFGEVYGDAMQGFIHVHHLRPISEAGAVRDVDPIEDLRPVCPNCHALIHNRKPIYTIEEASGLLKRDAARRNSPQDG